MRPRLLAAVFAAAVMGVAPWGGARGARAAPSADAVVAPDVVPTAGSGAAMALDGALLQDRPGAPAALAKPSRLRYVRPVPGALVAPFDAPPLRYAAGHRGADLAVAIGDPVRAAADGEVVFAGAVGGAMWVSIDHADGIRTSYGTLADLRVRAGDAVAGEDVLGRAAGTPHPGGGAAVHWGARRGAAYVDPMLLLARRRPTLLGPGGWRPADAPRPAGYGDWNGRRAWYQPVVPGSPVAAHAGWELAPNPNRVVGVAGLNSSSRSRPLELTHLGYGDDAITYLSYAGRSDGQHAGRAADSSPKSVQAPYAAPDTHRGVAAAARRLEDQLRADWASSPGQAVDLVGHSLGGVVIAYYLLFLHDPTDPGLPPIDHVVTIASPLEGADVADVAVAGRDHPRGERLLAAGEARYGLPPPGSRALDDLAVGSPLLRELSSRWQEATGDVHRSPLATGTSVLTLGAQADMVVPEHRSNLPGADHAVLPGSHDGVRATEASRTVVRAFLAGVPVPAEAGGLGHLASYWTSGVTQVVGRTVLGGWGRNEADGIGPW